MKQKILLGLVLTVLIGWLWLLKNGMFNAKTEAQAAGPLPKQVDYNFHIKPIISDKCYACHGPDANKRKANLRLDIADNAYAELSENPGKYALVAGKPNESEVYRRIYSEEHSEVMPPPDSQLSLNQQEKELIKKWIEQGAAYDRHWSYKPPVKAELPKPQNSAWIQNEIDAFVVAKLEANGLQPSKKAEQNVLLRRMSLDLTGLPPKSEFVKHWGDTITNYKPLIDSLQALTAYGERMTQAWLDVSRYADSHGYQDDSYRTMWPWRDWVIHAFTKNLAYDKFLTWQLAGDLLPNATLEQVLATGFNRNHPITQEGGVIEEEYINAYVVDRTNTLGKGILGLTLECAKCHDHKYDAISQKDYYGIYAFFNNVKERGLQMDAVQAANQKFFADPPFIAVTDKETEDLLSFINKPKGETVKVMVMNDSLPRESFVLNRGDYDNIGERVFPGTPEAILPFADELPKNRLGLAKWVTSKENPLTARVFVNRIWAMLFGNGLVKTAEDFGVQGSLPTHPELLDWLAVDFMENDWNIKYLLKKIMSSATYQQSSEMTPELLKADPENKLLARAQRFRMNGEMIRDYILATSGIMNYEIGGESVRPYQPAGLWEETNAGGNRGTLTTYVPDTGDKLYRRSLYTFWKRTLPPASMAIFDAPTRDLCEVRRQKTNTPLQALVLQNDIQVLEAARVLAQSILSENTDDTLAVNEVFQKILVRPPKQEELLMLESYYHDAIEKFQSGIEDANKLVTIGSFESKPTDPAKTAALMLTAQIIYNLDETITKE